MFTLTLVPLSRTLLVYKYFSCVPLLLRLNIAFTWSLNSCASQPRLAPRALRARRTLLGLRSLSTSDSPELLRSSGHLTLDPSDSSRNSFHPCLASVPVTGPANVHQTGSQPACRTRHLVPPLAARSDSGRSSVRDSILSLTCCMLHDWFFLASCTRLSTWPCQNDRNPTQLVPLVSKPWLHTSPSVPEVPDFIPAPLVTIDTLVSKPPASSSSFVHLLRHSSPKSLTSPSYPSSSSTHSS